MSRRAAPGKRWSATSSVDTRDEAGHKLDAGDPRAEKLVVRYRLDGKNRKASFTGAGCQDSADEFRSLLRAAYAGDWAADDKYRPLPPVQLPVAVEPEPEPIALPTAVASSAPRDISALTQWQLNRHKTTKKKRTGEDRSPGTVGGYASELKFIADNLRYQPGDPRLDILGVEPGPSIRIDDPRTGVNEHDLIALIDLRASANLRVRGVNERAKQKWARAVEAEEILAATERRSPVVPPMPEMKPKRFLPARSTRCVERPGRCSTRPTCVASSATSRGPRMSRIR